MGSFNQSEQIEGFVQEVLEHRWEDRERALELCSAIEVYGEEHEDSRLLGFAYFYKGELYYGWNNVEKMFWYIAKAVSHLGKSEQWELLARAYNLMAITSINRGNAPVALDYYLTSLNCCKEHNIASILCSVNINVGFLYMQNEVYQEAQCYFADAYTAWCSLDRERASIRSLTMIYTNIATCYMLRGMLAKTGEYIAKIEQECKQHFDTMDYIYVECMKAKYYHLLGEAALRDATIADIQEKISGDLLILDLFDDLYMLCELLLELERYDVLWDIINRMDSVLSQTKMENMERKLVSLKMIFYKKNGQQEKYLETAGRFYELAMLMEKESRKMISNMLYVRASLERANESKRKIEEINAILTKKSETDPLTGLANRYRLSEQFQTILQECIEKRKYLAVEILDIDYFKEYNDNYGHQAGDACIKKIADSLKALQGANTFVARYGGDEFVIIYRDSSEKKVQEKAKMLKESIMSLNISHKYSKAAAVVTISQGICVDIPEYEDKNWDFLSAADAFLYQVKRKERNGICIGNLKKEDVSCMTI